MKSRPFRRWLIVLGALLIGTIHGVVVAVRPAPPAVSSISPDARAMIASAEEARAVRRAERDKRRREAEAEIQELQDRGRREKERFRVPPEAGPPGARVTGTPQSPIYSETDLAIVHAEVRWVREQLCAGREFTEVFKLTGEGKRDTFVFGDLVTCEIYVDPKTLRQRLIWDDYMPYIDLCRRYFLYLGWSHPMEVYDRESVRIPPVPDSRTGLVYETKSDYPNSSLGFHAWIINGVDDEFIGRFPLSLVIEKDLARKEPRVGKDVYHAIRILANLASVDVLPFIHDRLVHRLVSVPDDPVWLYFRSILQERFPETGPARMRQHGLNPAALACWLGPLPPGYRRVDADRDYAQYFTFTLPVFRTFRYPHPLLSKLPPRKAP